MAFAGRAGLPSLISLQLVSFRFGANLVHRHRQIHAVVSLRSQKKPEKVLFNDVVGCDEAKDEIKQVT